VIIHAALRERNAHAAYMPAKTGDGVAAKKLVEDLLTAEGTDQMARLVKGRPVIMLGVTADEAGGFNAIPDAMAQCLAARLRLSVAAGSIVQANKVGHAKADAWHLLVTPAVFVAMLFVAGSIFCWTTISDLAARSPICGALSRAGVPG